MKKLSGSVFILWGIVIILVVLALFQLYKVTALVRIMNSVYETGRNYKEQVIYSYDDIYYI